MTTSARPFPLPLTAVSFGSLPLLFGFPLRFPVASSFFPFTTSAFASFVSGSGYSASCSSFQPSAGSASQWLSQRPELTFRFLRIFPFRSAWFPIRTSGSAYSALLFVPFRSSPLRSHSRSTGAAFSFGILLPIFPASSMRPLALRPPAFAFLRSPFAFAPVLPASVPFVFASFPVRFFRRFSTFPGHFHALLLPPCFRSPSASLTSV